MPANTNPIFSIQGEVSTDGTTGMSSAITASANDYTGAGANNRRVFTAGANGSFVQRLRFKALGTNVATVARVFLNNGSANTTSSNNTFYGEFTLPATTLSASTSTGDYDYSLNIALPAGFTIYVGLGTAVAAGWNVTAIGGDY